MKLRGDVILSYFMDKIPFIEGNKKLRKPQIEAYMKIRDYFSEYPNGEALVVLPTGTGKSGLISIAPYGISNGRVLIITPGLVTKKSVIKTLHPLEDNFWINFDIFLDPEDLPVVEEYDSDMLPSSLEKCNFIITNVHKLYKERGNSLLSKVPPDFFDMVIVDEAHHSVANTWEDALQYFRTAKKLHLTGTPYRGDGKPIPGELIHETKLSEVMALKYVKWLRKETVNNTEMYFTIPGNNKKYTKDEVLEFKDIEWIQKSVALSEECSMEVVKQSIIQLKKIKDISPKVPHKILAVACSIAHAKDVAKMYESQKMKVVVVHSEMSKEEIEENLLKIENNLCNVVVSVNMLMEGYDHKYLTVLAIFRPYRSLNAFAQIIGRVLRAIPDNEITDFAVDNNAVVVYHEETGLDTLWEEFAKEVQKSKKKPVKEYDISDSDYKKREVIYAGVELDDYYISGQDSYIAELDFNKMFENARKKIDDELKNKLNNLKKLGVSKEDIELFEKGYREKITNPTKNELDALLISKRPELARKQAREILYKDANDAVQDILEQKNIEAKGNTLYYKFKNQLPSGLPKTTTNDGVLVAYINRRLYNKFGPVNKREPEMLLLSVKYMNAIIDELRRML